MSRVIKFRAWWQKKKKMLHEVHDYYDTLGDAEHGNTEEPESSFGCILDNCDKYEVMQFTGLTDRNGVEVYEGDVVTAHYFYFEGGAEADGTHTGVVTYSEWASFGIDAGGNHGWLEIGETTHFEEPCIEVIGNKYEHPHLLEAKP